MTLTKSAGIVTGERSIQTKRTTRTKKEPLAKKAPEKPKDQSTDVQEKKSPTKDQSADTKAKPKKTRKPRTKKNPVTKTPAFKPTLMFVFETSNGFGIAQNYLRGAGLVIRAGKTDDGNPALQVEGNGTIPKRMLKMFRDYMKQHRVKYEEQKL